MIKRQYLPYLGLLLIPGIFIAVSFLHKEARGPMWLGSNYDPEYAYLVNSLSLAHDGPVDHLDHPGISTKYLGAFVINILNPFPEPQQEINFIREVLRYPEYYLDAIQFASLSLNTVLILILGLVAYRWTKSFWQSALLQTTPFISYVIPYYGTAKVSPEAMLLFTMLLFTLLLIIVIRDHDQRKSFWYALGFAAIVAFGVITKFNFFPIAIIPLLILYKIRYKLYYALATPYFFYLFSHYVIVDYKEFYDWIINTVYLSSGGTGPDVPLFNWHTVLNFAQTFVQDFRYLLAPIIVIFLAFIIFLIGAQKNKKIMLWRSVEFRYTVGVVLVYIVYCIIVSKRPNNSYFIPAFMLVVPLTLIYIQYIKQYVSDKWRVFLNAIAVSSIVLVILALYFSATDMASVITTANTDKRDQLTLYTTLETQYPGYGRIFSFRSSHPVAALSFGYDLSGQNYDAILRDLYYMEYSYSGEYGFQHWHDSHNLNSLYDYHHGKLLFISSPLSEEFIQTILSQYSLVVTPLYQGNTQTIYQIQR